MLEKFKSVVEGVNGRLLMAFCAVTAFLLAENASAQLVVPDTGVDVEAHITALITELGTILGAILLAWTAFFIVKKGWGWLRRVG